MHRSALESTKIAAVLRISLRFLHSQPPPISQAVIGPWDEGTENARGEAAAAVQEAGWGRGEEAEVSLG